MGKKDITLKDYFSDRRRYADLLNGSVFCGRQMIKAEELQDADTVQSKSDSGGVLERTNDIAMKQTKEGNIFAVWVVANQEMVDYSMPVRVMLQEALAYDRQLKEIKRANRRLQKEKQGDLKERRAQGDVFANSGEFLSGMKKEDRLYPIITLVIYWGEERWQGAENLHDIMQFGEDKTLADTLKTLVPKYPLHFLNLSQVHDYRNFRSEIRMLFELYDRRNDKEAFYEYLQHNADCRQIDEETAWALGKMLNFNMEKRKSRTVREEGGTADMCRAIEELIAEGKVEGKAEGDAARIVKSVESVMKNLRVEADRACSIIDVTLEEYQRAKAGSLLAL